MTAQSSGVAFADAFTTGFTYDALPMHVRFGPGVIAELGAELGRLGLGRALVLCSPEQEKTGELAAEALRGRAAGVLAQARMHVPIEVAHLARERAAALGADACVAVGGGSAIGLGKAVALEQGLPIVAVPTTYAGSEMTPVWGLTEGGRKRTGRDPRVLPVSVLYDPELTADLPIGMSVTSGLNAVAHAVESLYAPDSSPIVSMMAEEGVRAMTAALPAIVAAGSDRDARARALFGAWLCGACLGATTMSLHHKLCHALGGTLDLPHAPTHTAVLPHALAYNQRATPAAVAALSRALGAGNPARALWDLAGELGAPRSLAELGMAEADIARIAEQVVTSPYANPVPVTRDGVVRLLQAAWAGEPPAVGLAGEVVA
ncbi:maleylacetate reductase [Streptomyces chiangmaiensis]|uniref:Maleylacetate reductase n=1 Tax=Streptomyces chiangmaiensis TaxID=766497 RepID=A0ABU7FU07_9ACTN|nr:maleylacetate reductase [Streptomyces chiangmaiensis]MED7827595.1 maleylacetate reductase [Streptomyces chiangmaiensis]